MAFVEKTIDEIVIEDEPSFRHVGIYASLKGVLRRDGYKFRVLPAGAEGRWDRALFLNLTFWGVEGGGDVLVDEHVSADVIAHVAWHHLATRALPRPPTAAALFLGEAIASAFDLYLVGRLMGHSPRSTFLETQIPAMAETADAAGLSEEDFEEMLASIADNPERAFEDLRQLLCDASAKLMVCASPEDALRTLGELDGHRFASLLHRYELSNWILYARAYGNVAIDDTSAALDRELRAEKASIDWLESNWIDA